MADAIDDMFDDEQPDVAPTPASASEQSTEPTPASPTPEDKGPSSEPQEQPRPNRNNERWNKLVGTLKSKDEEIAQLKHQLQSKPESSATETAQLRQTVEKIEFKDFLKETRPELAKDADKLYEIKKTNPSMNFEDVVALHLGKSLMQSSEPNQTINRPISTAPATYNGKKLEDLPDAELERLVLEDRKQKGLI